MEKIKETKKGKGKGEKIKKEKRERKRREARGREGGNLLQWFKDGYAPAYFYSARVAWQISRIKRQTADGRHGAVEHFQSLCSLLTLANAA